MSDVLVRGLTAEERLQDLRDLVARHEQEFADNERRLSVLRPEAEHADRLARSASDALSKVRQRLDALRGHPAGLEEYESVLASHVDHVVRQHSAYQVYDPLKREVRDLDSRQREIEGILLDIRKSGRL